MVLVLSDFPIILPFKQKQQQQKKTKPKKQQKPQNPKTPHHHQQKTKPNTKVLVKMSLYILFLTPVFDINYCSEHSIPL